MPLGNLNCTSCKGRKSRKDSSKRKRKPVDSNNEVNSTVLQASTANELDESTLLHNKRHKSESQSLVDIVHQGFPVWVCQNRQVEKNTLINFDNDACFNDLLRRLCTMYDQSIDKAVLFLRSPNDIWSEITAENGKTALCELEIKHYNLISVEEKKLVATSTNIEAHLNDSNVNPVAKIHLIVKDSHTKEEMQVECDENDTVYTLKQKIFAELPSDSENRIFELFVDSKLMDTAYDNRTLASLDILSTSTFTITIRQKLKAKRSNQVIRNRGLCGLRNLGNTCYMNSALQCLSHVLPLTDYFLQQKDVDGDVAQSYFEFIKNVWNNQTLFEPRRIKKSVSRYAPQFAHFTQEDAHEFMIFLLNQLHLDLKQQESTSIISELFHGRVNGITTCLTCGFIRSTANLITFIPVSLDKNKKKRRFTIDFEPIHPETLIVELDASSYVKHLLLAIIKELQLRYQYSKNELFKHVQILSTRNGQELALETPLNDILHNDLKLIECEGILRKAYSLNCIDQTSFDLIDCMRDFMALETPETLWFCKGKCQRPVHVAKKMELSSLPDILIVQLRRFIDENQHKRKLHTFISFPLHHLDLSEFLGEQPTTSLYDLIAVVNHIGATIDRGHYTTYARHLTNPSAWFSFNDEYVSPIAETDIVSQDAYILVYIKHEKDASF